MTVAVFHAVGMCRRLRHSLYTALRADKDLVDSWRRCTHRIPSGPGAVFFTHWATASTTSSMSIACIVVVRDRILDSWNRAAYCQRDTTAGHSGVSVRLLPKLVVPDGDVAIPCLGLCDAQYRDAVLVQQLLNQWLLPAPSADVDGSQCGVGIDGAETRMVCGVNRALTTSDNADNLDKSFGSVDLSVELVRPIRMA
ncbi:hypothetical protein CBL_05220 [Carabus blaptoides fortunei]